MTRPIGEGSKKNSAEWEKKINENGRIVYVKINNNNASIHSGRVLDRNLKDENSHYYDSQVQERISSDTDLMDQVYSFADVEPLYTDRKPFEDIKYESYNYLADAYDRLENFSNQNDYRKLFSLYSEVALSEIYADMISCGFIKESKSDPEYKQLFSDYRAFLAETVDKTYKMSGGSAIAMDYKRNTLGNMHPVAHYRPGTREWLESRQEGVGASDINILVHHNGKYDEEKLLKVFRSKVEPISDEQVELQDENNRDYFNPMHRGASMEDLIADVAMAKTPHMYEFYHDKRTWSGGHSDIVRINYDYMFDSNLSDRKVIDGTLEIKTASTFSGWGEDVEDINSVSKRYRPQLLVQARMADMNYASIAVMVNERDHRMYNIEMTDELREEADEYIRIAEKFYKDCQKYKQTGIKPDIILKIEKKMELRKAKEEKKKKAVDI